MPNRSLVVLSFACIGVLTAVHAQAQSMLADKKDVTGVAARRMIEVCLAQAAREATRSRWRSSIPTATFCPISRRRGGPATRG